MHLVAPVQRHPADAERTGDPRQEVTEPDPRDPVDLDLDRSTSADRSPGVAAETRTLRRSAGERVLAPMAAAFADGGTERFARTLYGLSWSPRAAGGPGAWLDDEVTARELAMFRSFEPAPPSPAAGRVVVTFGTNSPGIRRDAAEALRAAHGHEIRPVPGVAHFAAYDEPETFARTVHEVVAGA